MERTSTSASTSASVTANLFSYILATKKYAAVADISGGSIYPRIHGTMCFYQTPYTGILVTVEIWNLPDHTAASSSNFYGMHLHETGDCSNDFANTGNHYNPFRKAHPDHAGDMPPLLSNSGYAWMSFYDARLSLKNIIGRSVIIHSKPDDFTTQPSGNSGEKIACAVVVAVNPTFSVPMYYPVPY